MLNNKNPEFIKNVWLEINNFKLIATPIILFLIFLLTYLLGKNHESSIQNVEQVSYLIYLIYIFLLATSKSAYSVLDEVANGTWDLQRMSCTSPTKIILGKLFGSTSFCWYVALICLVGSFGNMAWLSITPETIYTESDTIYSYQSFTSEISFLILSGIFSQIVTLYLSLGAVSSAKAYIPKRTQVVFGQILAVSASLYYYSLSTGTSGNDVIWYGIHYDSYKFSLTFLIINIIWLFVGSVRLIMKDFQYDLKPIAWILFVIYCLFFTGGFDLGYLDYWFASPLCLVVSLTYITSLTMPKESSSYKQLVVNLRSKAWKKLFEELPLWLVSYILIIPVMLFAFAEIFTKENNFTAALLLAIATFSAISFVTRDVLIFYYCSITSKSRSSITRPLLYLGILYILIPGIFTLSESHLFTWFLPIAFVGLDKYNSELIFILEMLLPAIMNVAIMVYIVRNKLKEIQLQLENKSYNLK